MNEAIQLPQPKTEGPMSLEEAILRRRSVRRLGGPPLTPEQLSQLLWATQGITGARRYRAAPSAGALYPLELYTVTAEGISHYDPQGHSLTRVRQGDLREELCAASQDQRFVREAPLTVAITAVYARVQVKYGKRRGARYVEIEVGHAAQNLHLQAVALGLASVPVGAFDDEGVHAVLGVPAEHEPLYLVPIGKQLS
jgi:SagB-type dehydrogenase family enzyme